MNNNWPLGERIEATIADLIVDENGDLVDSTTGEIIASWYVSAARYDEYVYEYVAYDAHGLPHWADRAWDAELAAVEANRVLRKHMERNPGEYADWLDWLAQRSDMRAGL